MKTGNLVAALGAQLAYTGTEITYDQMASLASADLVQRHGPHDPGASVSLTLKGRQALIELVAAAKSAEADAERSLGQNEVRMLKIWLRLIIDELTTASFPSHAAIATSIVRLVHTPPPPGYVIIQAGNFGFAFMNDEILLPRILQILHDHARLSQDTSTLKEEDDLYEAGMTSHASVNVMLALEGEFEAEFPNHTLTRSIFSSIGSIRVAIAELTSS